jgi:hypothetical protein
MSVERVNPHGMPADEKVTTLHELALYLGGSYDSWTGDLLRLIAKSDPAHREALRSAFPITVAVWTRWNESDPQTVAELTAVATAA